MDLICALVGRWSLKDHTVLWRCKCMVAWGAPAPSKFASIPSPWMQSSWTPIRRTSMKGTDAFHFVSFVKLHCEWGISAEYIKTIIDRRHVWFWKYELFELLAIFTLYPVVKSFSMKFRTVFVAYNEVLVVLNFPWNRMSSNIVSRPPWSTFESRGCLLDTYFEEMRFSRGLWRCKLFTRYGNLM